MNETDIIRVYIPNGTFKSVRYDFETKVQVCLDTPLRGKHSLPCMLLF